MSKSKSDRHEIIERKNYKSDVLPLPLTSPLLPLAFCLLPYLMIEPVLKSAIAQALLVQYDFDLGNETAEEIVSRWVRNYEIDWLPLAAIEALYQGRYKAISVQQILTLWKRREKPIYHFNSEFEMLVRRHLPEELRLRYETDINPPQRENPPPLEKEKSESPQLLPTPETPREETGMEETPLLPLQESPPGSVRHPDFYRKLKSVADKKPPEENG